MKIDIQQQPNWLIEASTFLEKNVTKEIASIKDSPEQCSLSFDRANELFDPLVKYINACMPEVDGIFAGYGDVKRFFEPVSDNREAVITLFMRFMHGENVFSFDDETLKGHIIDFVYYRMSDEENFCDDWRGHSFDDVLIDISKSSLSPDFKLMLLDLYSNRQATFSRIKTLLDAVARVMQNNFELVSVAYFRELEKLSDINFLTQTVKKSMGIDNSLLSYSTTLTASVSLISFYSMSMDVNDPLYLYLRVGFLFCELQDGRDRARFNTEYLAETFKLLGDKSRISILKLLLERDMYAQELAKALKLTPATVSHHLERLLLFKMVTVSLDQNNKKIYYSFDCRGFANLREFLELFDGKEM